MTPRASGVGPAAGAGALARGPAMSETHFGFEKVPDGEKARRVRGVFDSVASRYDLMNDLMSMGLHRLWKAFTIQVSGVRAGERVLDVAGGTADLASAFAKRVGPTGEVWLTDINNAMLDRGRDRLLDEGVLGPVAQCDAEKLPFPDDHFDVVTVAFGLRNMTHKEAGAGRNAPRAAARRPPAGAGVLQGLGAAGALLRSLFVQGAALAGRQDRRATPTATATSPNRSACTPTRRRCKAMMEQAGLERVEYFNLTAGVVALHLVLRPLTPAAPSSSIEPFAGEDREYRKEIAATPPWSASPAPTSPTPSAWAAGRASGPSGRASPRHRPPRRPPHLPAPPRSR